MSKPKKDGKTPEESVLPQQENSTANAVDKKAKKPPVHKNVKAKRVKLPTGPGVFIRNGEDDFEDVTRGGLDAIPTVANGGITENK